MGMMRQFGELIQFSETPGTIHGPPPLVGENTREILDWLGYTDEPRSTRSRPTTSSTGPAPTTPGRSDRRYAHFVSAPRSCEPAHGEAGIERFEPGLSTQSGLRSTRQIRDVEEEDCGLVALGVGDGGPATERRTGRASRRRRRRSGTTDTGAEHEHPSSAVVAHDRHADIDRSESCTTPTTALPAVDQLDQRRTPMRPDPPDR